MHRRQNSERRKVTKVNNVKCRKITVSFKSSIRYSRKFYSYRVEIKSVINPKRSLVAFKDVVTHNYLIRLLNVQLWALVPLNAPCWSNGLWVELPGNFCRTRTHILCANHSSDPVQQQHVDSLTDQCAATKGLQINYSFCRLWCGEERHDKLFPGHPRGGGGKIWGELAGLLAGVTDRCFHFCPSFVLLFACLTIISRCCATPNRFFSGNEAEQIIL